MQMRFFLLLAVHYSVKILLQYEFPYIIGIAFQLVMETLLCSTSSINFLTSDRVSLWGRYISIAPDVEKKLAQYCRLLQRRSSRKRTTTRWCSEPWTWVKWRTYVVSLKSSRPTRADWTSSLTTPERPTGIGRSPSPTSVSKRKWPPIILVPSYWRSNFSVVLVSKRRCIL